MVNRKPSEISALFKRTALRQGIRRRRRGRRKRRKRARRMKRQQRTRRRRQRTRTQQGLGAQLTREQPVRLLRQRGGLRQPLPEVSTEKGGVTCS